MSNAEHTSEYARDKYKIFQWFIGLVATAGLTYLNSINSKLESYGRFSDKTELRMKNVEDKNNEQDGRLTRMEERDREKMFPLSGLPQLSRKGGEQ